MKGQENQTIAGAIKDTSTVRRTIRAKTDENKATEIAEIVKINPKEICIINSGLKNNKQILVDCLNLSNTKTLRNFRADKRVADHLRYPMAEKP